MEGKAYCPIDDEPEVVLNIPIVTTVYRNAMLTLITFTMVVVSDMLIAGYKTRHACVGWFVIVLAFGLLLMIHRSYVLFKAGQAIAFIGNGYTALVGVVTAIRFFCVDCILIRVIADDATTTEIAIKLSGLFVCIYGLVALSYKLAVLRLFFWTWVTGRLSALKRANQNKVRDTIESELSAAGGFVGMNIPPVNNTLLYVRGSQSNQVVVDYNDKDKSYTLNAHPRANPNTSANFEIKVSAAALDAALAKARQTGGYTPENATSAISQTLPAKNLKNRVIPVFSIDNSGKQNQELVFVDNASIFSIPERAKNYLHVVRHTFGSMEPKTSDYGLLQIAQNGKIVTFKALIDTKLINLVNKLPAYSDIDNDSIMFEIVDADRFAAMFGINWSSVPKVDISSSCEVPASVSIWSFRPHDCKYIDAQTAMMGYTSHGTINADYHDHPEHPLLQLHTCNTRKGDSGSLITNRTGTVAVAIHIGGDSSGIPVNYCIPLFALCEMYGLVQYHRTAPNADDSEIAVIGFEVSGRTAYGKGHSLIEYLEYHQKRDKRSKETRHLSESVDTERLRVGDNYSNTPSPDKAIQDQITELSNQIWDATKYSALKIEDSQKRNLAQFEAIEEKLRQLFQMAERSDSLKVLGGAEPLKKIDSSLKSSLSTVSEREESSDSSFAASAPPSGQRLPSESNTLTQSTSTVKSGKNSERNTPGTSRESGKPPKDSTPQTDKSMKLSQPSSAVKASTSPVEKKSETPSIPTSESGKSTSGQSSAARQSRKSAHQAKPEKPPATLEYPSNATLAKLKISKEKFAGMSKSWREMILASEAFPKK
jgi:hypothetical protein